jgi:acetyl esterase/lipase
MTLMVTGLRRLRFAALSMAWLSLTAAAMPAGAPLPPRAPFPQAVPAPAIIPLWPKGAPGSERRRTEPEQAADYWVKNIHNPSLTVFPADPRHANGSAIIVIPGGGHKLIVWTTEGTAVASRLNQMGVTTFVLKYRLAREAGSSYTIEGDAMVDVRRAVRWVRAHAADYGLDPHRIGVMGFSAGGELVSLLADNPASATAPSSDPLDKESARPDFQILVFPGPLGVPAKAVADAPPAFLTAGSLDACCAEPAVTLYEQLRKAGVPAELHMYAGADHAFNLGERSGLLSIQHWPDRLADWLTDSGWLDTHSAPDRGAKP